MLINLSNHNSSKWPENQKATAENLYGSVTDFSFPTINPTWTKEQVAALAEETLNKCLVMLPKTRNNAIHIMGEMTFTYVFVNLAKQKGITCVASTTERLVETNEKGKKVSVFKFVKFREY
jgi:hypothetical protein